MRTHPRDTPTMLAPQGIGPATGSAILEAADPSVAFTSDEAMQAALNSKDYTGEQSRAEQSRAEYSCALVSRRQALANAAVVALCRHSRGG